MDIQTRFGLGGTAFFTLVAIALTTDPSWMSVSIMAVCALVACWGFLPLLSKLPLRVFPRRVPLHIAAQRVYEAVERAGDLDLTTPSNSSPETKLNHFKMLLMVDDGEQNCLGLNHHQHNPGLFPKKNYLASYIRSKVK